MAKRSRLLRSRMINGGHYIWTYDSDGNVLVHVVIRDIHIRVIKGVVLS